MNSTLCIDSGNTFTKWALVQDGIVVFDDKIFSSDVNKTFAKRIAHIQAHAVAISAVSNTEKILSKIWPQLPVIKINAAQKLPFENLYKTGETLGADRIALAAAASTIYPMQHTLVIAVGTCITYNFVNNNNCFIGGAISPGLHMRLRAMHEYTAKLPLVENYYDVALVANDTVSNLQSGAWHGLVAEIAATIEKYENLYPNFNCVVTGGDMAHVVPHIKKRIFADAHFLFKGMHAIAVANR